MGRIIRYTLAGAVGAIIAWGVMEPTSLMPSDERALPYSVVFLIGLISGFMVGLALGIAESASGLSPRDSMRSILMGALIGACGGILGLTFGNAIYSQIYSMSGASSQSLPSNVPAEALPPSESAPSFLTFFLLLIGRGFGWALIGGFIGLSQGVAVSSTKKMINGAIGGFIGGGIGGSVFEILAWLNKGGVANFPPSTIRFISFAITGAAIGLFIGFIEEVTKKAWLIRLVGKNEGKEYTIYKSRTILGRSELVDIAIFGDPDVSPNHAQIIAIGRRHSIEDLGSTSGVSVNGTSVSNSQLADGDVIVIGKTRFLYKDKETANRSRAGSVSLETGVAIPNSQHICQFCGSMKDANGNCSCSVGAPQSPFAQPQTQSQPVQNAVPTSQAFNAQAAGKIVGVSGPYAGNTFSLQQGETIIGRDAAAAVPLPLDNSVSRIHAKVVLENGSFVLYDNNSTNGTYLNNSRVTTPCKINNYDVIQIGSTKFRFEC